MSEESRIAVGQLVRLKSGGPLMVVESRETRGLLCAWFEKHALQTLGALEGVPESWGAPMHDYFHAPALEVEP